jgi:hypothetical protein
MGAPWLQEGAAAAADEEEDGGSGGGDVTAAAQLALLPDAAAPELLYAVHSSGAHALTLPWLPLLAGSLGGGDGRLPAALPPPGAEALLRSRAGVVAAAAVGGALAGSALVVLEAGGEHCCLRPHLAAAAAGEPAARLGGAAAAAASEARQEVEAQLATVYGDLRKGETPPPPPCPQRALPSCLAARLAVLMAQASTPWLVLRFCGDALPSAASLTSSLHPPSSPPTQQHSLRQVPRRASCRSPLRGAPRARATPRGSACWWRRPRRCGRRTSSMRTRPLMTWQR